MLPPDALLVPRRGFCLIVYNLRCNTGHEFEGWFRSSDAFDDQAKALKLMCPVCGTSEVSKAMMAPAVSGTKKSLATPAPQQLRQMRQFMTGLRKYVQDNAEYVGPKFPEEA